MQNISKTTRSLRLVCILLLTTCLILFLTDCGSSDIPAAESPIQALPVEEKTNHTATPEVSAAESLPTDSAAEGCAAS